MPKYLQARPTFKRHALLTVDVMLLILGCIAAQPSDASEQHQSATAKGDAWSDSAGSNVAPGHAGAMDRQASYQSLRQRLQLHGRLPVIVFLNVPASESHSKDPSDARQQSILADTQKHVINGLIRLTGRPLEDFAIKTFDVTPAVALQIDQQGLDALLADPAVSHIQEDSAVPPATGN